MPEFLTEVCGCLVCLAVLVAVAVVWPIIFLCGFGVICKKKGPGAHLEAGQQR